MYRWNILVAGLPVHIGATHAKEMVFIWDDLKGWDYDVNPFLNKPESYVTLAKTMSKSIAAFIATGDPNGANDGNDASFHPERFETNFKTNVYIVGGITWPKYDLDQPQNFVFGNYTTGDISVEVDNKREGGKDYIIRVFSEITL